MTRLVFAHYEVSCLRPFDRSRVSEDRDIFNTESWTLLELPCARMEVLSTDMFSHGARSFKQRSVELFTGKLCVFA